MVSFSPMERIAAEDCLQNPYFDDIRKPKTEKPASKVVTYASSFKSRDEAVEFLKNEI